MNRFVSSKRKITCNRQLYHSYLRKLDCLSKGGHAYINNLCSVILGSQPFIVPTTHKFMCAVESLYFDPLYYSHSPVKTQKEIPDIFPF